MNCSKRKRTPTSENIGMFGQSKHENKDLKGWNDDLFKTLFKNDTLFFINVFSLLLFIDWRSFHAPPLCLIPLQEFFLNRPTQLADQNIRISTICGPKLALLGPKNADFGPKIQFFWYHVTLIFGLRWTQLWDHNIYPHHEVTLDNFGFLVDAHSTAWWAVKWPHMGQILQDGENGCFMSNFF